MLVSTDITDAVQLAVGFNFACVRRSGGAVMCWGLNSSGQLGDGSTMNRPTPVGVRGVGGVGMLTDAVDIVAGGEMACAERAGGSVVCWGANADGQLGAGSAMSQHTTPVTVVGVTSPTALGAGRRHVCAITATGTRCWGDSAEGQIGDGTTTDRDPSVAVSPL